jgi:hypothetical protein
LNRNVNEGVSWNLPAISISFVINCNPPDLFLLSFLIADRTSSSEMLKSNSLKFKLSFSFSKRFCSRFKSCCYTSMSMGILLTPLLVFHVYTPFGDVIRHLSW